MIKKKKRIGILGGMSPISTVDFYQHIIDKYSEKFDDEEFPEIVIFSVNFGEILKLQDANEMEVYISKLSNALKILQNAGAEVMAIPSNTPHMVFDELAKVVDVPLLSIVRTAADVASERGYTKLLLLGTEHTMSKTFYQDEFSERNMEVVVPSLPDQEIVGGIISRDLDRGVVNNSNRQQMYRIIDKFDVGAVILGCTELSVILKPEDSKLPLLDTNHILAEAILEHSIT